MLNARALWQSYFQLVLPPFFHILLQKWIYNIRFQQQHINNMGLCGVKRSTIATLRVPSFLSCIFHHTNGARYNRTKEYEESNTRESMYMYCMYTHNAHIYYSMHKICFNEQANVQQSESLDKDTGIEMKKLWNLIVNVICVCVCVFGCSPGNHSALFGTRFSALIQNSTYIIHLGATAMPVHIYDIVVLVRMLMHANWRAFLFALARITMCRKLATAGNTWNHASQCSQPHPYIVSYSICLSVVEFLRRLRIVLVLFMHITHNDRCCCVVARKKKITYSQELIRVYSCKE